MGLFLRGDQLIGFKPLEAVFDKRILESGSSVKESWRGCKGVSTIQLGLLFSPGLGKAQHPSQNLLDSPRGADLSYRTQDVGKRAIPPFLESLHGDDEAQGAGSLQQIHVGNPRV